MQKVYIAGAGPGDSDLITLKLCKILKNADVIIVDRLVNPEIIATHVSANTKIIFVGKEGYNKNSITQLEINAIIIEEALKGLQVVRLKGGDVALFSNVLDELNALSSHNIPFEIIPGITAASGASAYTGIPLTARGFANSVRFFSYEEENNITEKEWKELGSTSDTLVVYMGSKKINSLLENICKYTNGYTMPIAVIEQATTQFQKIFTGIIKNNYVENMPKHIVTPALIIIGSVVELEKKFNWFESTTNNGTVFNKILSI